MMIINTANREGKQKIEDVEEFEAVAEDVLNDFVQKLREPYVHKLTEEEKEDYEEGAEWLFTTKGTSLYDRYRDRLRKIGEYYFGKDEMFFADISASCVSDY